MNGDKPVKRTSPSVWRLATTGVELSAAVIGGSLLGYWIDRHFETGPWGLLIGAGIGIVGGLYNMIRKAVLDSLRLGGKQPSPTPHNQGRGEGPGSGDRPTGADSP